MNTEMVELVKSLKNDYVCLVGVKPNSKKSWVQLTEELINDGKCLVSKPKEESTYRRLA